MKISKFITAIVLGLVLFISIKVYVDHKRSEQAKENLPDIEYEVASQSRQAQEKYWEGDY